MIIVAALLSADTTAAQWFRTQEREDGSEEEADERLNTRGAT